MIKKNGVFRELAADATSKEDVINKIKDNTPGDPAIATDPAKIINVLLFIGGIVAVTMIIVAGIQMTTSAGDPSAVKKAKNTLMWSVVGLVIMILAYAIVNFVIFRVVGSQTVTE